MRKASGVLLFVFLGLLTAGSPATAQGKKWALLIGIEKYDHAAQISQLRFAVKDVNSLANTLQNLGYEPANMRVMTSAIQDADDPLRPTNDNIIATLERLAKSIKPEDTFLFYFTGHGFAKGNENFLASVNANPTSVNTLRHSAISLDDLQQAMKNFKAKQILFVIDACRNDPEVGGKGDAENKLTEDFSKSLVVVSRAAQTSVSGVLFACSNGERAFEDTKKEHSIFTYYLLEALSGKAGSKGPLAMADVMKYVRKQVGDWADNIGKKQTPELLPQEANNLVLADKIADNPEQPALGGGNKGHNSNIVLFDGSDLSSWRNSLGKPAAWYIQAGDLVVATGTGDIGTTSQYQDYQLHVEFNLADMPNQHGQQRSNSGVILNGQYEIQILDSVDNSTYFAGGCGAIFGQRDPDKNVCRLPGQWQTYDITFYSPRLDQYGRVLKKPRITLVWNGVKVHDDVQIDAPNFPNPRNPAPMVAAGPILLQDHGAPVRFRNIWITPIK